ncbi:hypothetical protein P7C70_g8078, partial [Phenoliferia sp. Uapishka_3]
MSSFNNHYDLSNAERGEVEMIRLDVSCDQSRRASSATLPPISADASSSSLHTGTSHDTLISSLSGYSKPTEQTPTATATYVNSATNYGPLPVSDDEVPEEPIPPPIKRKAVPARNLKRWHVAMISISGTIGTGLFLGTSDALRTGGPVSLDPPFPLVSTDIQNQPQGWNAHWVRLDGKHRILHDDLIGRDDIVHARWRPYHLGAKICRSSLRLHPGIHISLLLVHRVGIYLIMINDGARLTFHLCHRFPTELSAAVVLVKFWHDYNELWIYFLLWATALALNLLPNHWYGQVEVLTIIGLLFMGLIIDVGGNPKQEYIGATYWHNPGPWVQFSDIEGVLGRFLGVSVTLYHSVHLEELAHESFSSWSTVVQSAFSYIGAEITAIAAMETENPREILPKAIRDVWIRIFQALPTRPLLRTWCWDHRQVQSLRRRSPPKLMLTGSVQYHEQRSHRPKQPSKPRTQQPKHWFLSFCKSHIRKNKMFGPGPEISHFQIIALKHLEVSQHFQSFLNVTFIIAAFSAASTDIYTGSRTLYILARENFAWQGLRTLNLPGFPYKMKLFLEKYLPGVLDRVKRFLGLGVSSEAGRQDTYRLPVRGIILASAFGSLAFMSATGKDSAGRVFALLSKTASISGLMTWAGICFTYTRFYEGVKIQRIDRKKFKYRAPFQPYAAWYALISMMFVLVFNTWQVMLPGKWNTADFLTGCVLKRYW